MDEEVTVQYPRDWVETKIEEKKSGDFLYKFTSPEKARQRLSDLIKQKHPMLEFIIKEEGDTAKAYKK